ncbi:MAG: putative Exopolyphosphatase [Verrucomicrobiales bacterium]|nr:putative Exopolyphosphatase [Verrucomicrobiales bacterium]
MSEDLARQEFLALMREMEHRPIHVSHVAQLALQMFDGLLPLHNLGPRERLILEGAGHLHDIGHKFDSTDGGEGHHKQSARLISQRPWQHFTPREVAIMALVARYHRKSPPDLQHSEFAALPEPERVIVEKLSALLRLADSLDRNHEQFVDRVTPEIHPEKIIFRLEANGPVLREVIAAHKKGELAIIVFRRSLVFMLNDQIIDPAAPPWRW